MLPFPVSPFLPLFRELYLKVKEAEFGTMRETFIPWNVKPKSCSQERHGKLGN
jgi:hypothetical protein